MLVPDEHENLLFEKAWSEDAGSFRLSIDNKRFAVVRFIGKGSMASTRAFIAALDEGHAAIGEVEAVRALIDLRKLDGAPLRGQLLLGKWLLHNKQHFYRVAVFGGKAWEMGFARAVAKIARFANIGFFADEAEAVA